MVDPRCDLRPRRRDPLGQRTHPRPRWGPRLGSHGATPTDSPRRIHEAPQARRRVLVVPRGRHGAHVTTAGRDRQLEVGGRRGQRPQGVGIEVHGQHRQPGAGHRQGVAAGAAPEVGHGLDPGPHEASGMAGGHDRAGRLLQPVRGPPPGRPGEAGHRAGAQPGLGGCGRHDLRVIRPARVGPRPADQGHRSRRVVGGQRRDERPPLGGEQLLPCRLGVGCAVHRAIVRPVAPDPAGSGGSAPRRGGWHSCAPSAKGC